MQPQSYNVHHQNINNALPIMHEILTIIKQTTNAVKTKRTKKGGQQFSAQKLFLVLFFGEWEKVFPAKTILVRDLSQS